MQVGLSSNSLNDGDAFILGIIMMIFLFFHQLFFCMFPLPYDPLSLSRSLDNGLTVYQWNGKGANWSEKQKANQICKVLNTTDTTIFSYLFFSLFIQPLAPHRHCGLSEEANQVNNYYLYVYLTLCLSSERK